MLFTKLILSHTGGCRPRVNEEVGLLELRGLQALVNDTG